MATENVEGQEEIGQRRYSYFLSSFRMVKAKRSIMSANEEKPSSHGKL
jgi:hypothetical protein